MPKIVIQSGHVNCQNNSIVSLRSSSGAPGEQELTKRIADRLSSVLRTKGFEVIQTDANANDNHVITDIDYDLFLALHGDADYPSDAGGGFATFPEPSTDSATIESQRIAKVINEIYYPETKIVYKDRANANTKFYYMWKYLTAKTPCVLLEMGQVQDPHDKILLSNTDLIVNAIGRAVCKAFNVPFDASPTPPVPPTVDYKKKYEETQMKLDDAIERLADILNEKFELQKKLAEIHKISKE